MRIRQPVLAAVAAPVIVLGVTAGIAAAQDDGSEATGDSGARAAFVCENLDRIGQLQADHATLLADRLALLQDARVAAETAGDSKALDRIDRRVERLTEHQSRLGERAERLETWAAEHC